MEMKKKYIKRFFNAALVLGAGVLVQMGLHWLGFDQITAAIIAIVVFTVRAIWPKCKACIRTRVEDLTLFAAGSLHIMFAAWPGMMVIIMMLAMFNFVTREG